MFRRGWLSIMLTTVRTITWASWREVLRKVGLEYNEEIVSDDVEA